MEQPTKLILPDLFALTPFPWRGPNPFHHLGNKESTEWILRYDMFTDYMRSRVIATQTELLGAYAYPYADAKGLRIASDFITLLTALDEYTDAQDAEGAKATRDIFVEALTGNPNVSSPITLFTNEFLERISGASKDVRERFIAHCTEYINATMNEASLRTTNACPSFDEYLQIRRHNGGIYPCYDIIEVTMGITLPAEVFKDSNFQHVVLAANDMMGLSNDIYSYAVEYAKGLAGCNVITVLMKSESLSQQEAMDRAAELYKKCGSTLVCCKEKIQSFGTESDKVIQAYVHGLEQWVYGNLVWSLDTPRFFGVEREEVKRTRVVKINRQKSAL